MKGLSREAYAQLVAMSQEGEERILQEGDPLIALNEELTTQGRVRSYVEVADGFEWRVHVITPLGKLAISLWPTIREGE